MQGGSAMEHERWREVEGGQEGRVTSVGRVAHGCVHAPRLSRSYVADSHGWSQACDFT